MVVYDSDLKPDNILLSATKGLKLGSCKFINLAELRSMTYSSFKMLHLQATYNPAQRLMVPEKWQFPPDTLRCMPLLVRSLFLVKFVLFELRLTRVNHYRDYTEETMLLGERLVVLRHHHGPHRPLSKSSCAPSVLPCQTGRQARSLEVCIVSGSLGKGRGHVHTVSSTGPETPRLRRYHETGTVIHAFIQTIMITILTESRYYCR
jgi:hypothetical protein